MALSIADEFEVRCGECGSTLRYRVGHATFHVLGVPTPPVAITPLDRQQAASFEGCPHGRDNCAGVKAAMARLHQMPEYVKWRHRPEVAAWYDRLEARRPAQ
jgi:hypothetical protein